MKKGEADLALSDGLGGAQDRLDGWRIGLERFALVMHSAMRWPGLTPFLPDNNERMDGDARLYAPAAARNREPILDALRRQLPSRGLVLEVASGTGEHIAHFAQASGRDLIFQPSDPDPAARASIDAWASALGLGNVRSAIALDAAREVWPIPYADAVLCINLIHISPWGTTVGLMHGAARVLPLNGLLFLYGPFRREGRHTSVSNAAFDQDLRLQNPAWGVRDLEAVVALAESHGFSPPLIEEMPANNLSLAFRRRAARDNMISLGGV